MLLRSKFSAVYFVVGNHDLWIRGDFSSSISKYEQIIEFCEQNDIETTPKLFGSVLVVPLLSWYHESWDTEPEITSLIIPPIHEICADYRMCRWPSNLPNGSLALASYFDQLNKPLAIPKEATMVLSFSHFLPHQELLPEKRKLFYPNLPKMCGSEFLRKRISDLRPAVHVFGHTHFGWDAVIDGTRFVQAPLCYPRERDHVRTPVVSGPPAIVLGSVVQAIAPIANSPDTARTPHDTTPAPWVVSRFPRRIDPN